MKRLIIWILSIFLFAFTSPAAAETSIPKEAQEFADRFFYNIVVEELGTEHAANFNLDPDSTNITFGPLFQRFSVTPEFVQEKNPDLSNGIVPSDEYLSVVYQDGKPINVIGTYKNEAGEFALSTFGYGIDLAKRMDKFKGDEVLLYEGPADAWYLYTGKKIKPLNDPAKQLMKEEKDISDYQKIIHERYKDADPNPEMGGGIIVPENNNDDNKTTTILYSIIGLLGITSVGLFFKNRQLKHSQK
ncbi:hypothetical protein G3A_06720 [Bacillus sp. 17376]|uniref:Uncharacterized protein n=1 Tax=Mesobacillus boroniphilus JCM 21738 TaxID=1294265 RepID=W4RLL6_9BACI|nr:hypothetical protein [Mesobacillus boroniphilus]ESU33369.1 hypothetical protein G3A_06720 [Bacillus sp. 17376]GAE44783.1 hypothetical protein JCM21738_1523 [Mesobacillus boroniphilus JCM 21738]